ncbi:MAG: alkaline phosphatase family protein [Saprospiraceae bacterium]|nr:alkaline phosphatase family protein [Saprospiraceae bacterium]
MRKARLLVMFVAGAVFACPVFSQQDKPGQHPKNDVLQEKTGKVIPDIAEDIEVLDREAYAPRPLDTMQGLATIAFGSCNKIHMPQLWTEINANNPNLWIWLGDIIYADTTDTKALAAHYKRLKTNPDYKKLRSKAQVIGIYDDHDYGLNDGGKDHPTKKGAKKCLMDFLDVPMNSPVRKREGAYTSYTFGKGEQRIKIIMLDTRYFRDALEPDPEKKRRYVPNLEGTILGEEQWKWLENELRTTKANLTFLCSSVQVLSDEHPHEKWGNFPNERKRLLNLIAQTKPKNLMILSGDRHMAEISKMEIQGLPYPLYDFTSSGLTHIRSGTSEANRYRVGDMILKRNFGILKIYWVNDKPVVTMQIRGPQNELFQEMVVKY